VSRWLAVERAMREVGHDEADIKRTMAELMGAFKKSDEAGPAKWVKIRKAVLRRRAEANAFTKAEKVEALAVKTSWGAQGEVAKEWAEVCYGKPESKKRTSLTRKCTLISSQPTKKPGRRCGDGALIFVTSSVRG
jgi:hypothetical protein